VVELEEELHTANNSTDYWNYEYNQLLSRYEQLNTDSDPVQKFLQECSIIDKAKVLDFIKSL